MAINIHESAGVFDNLVDASQFTLSASGTKAGIVGVADKGPTGVPTLITSQQEFIDVFGYRTSKGGTALAIASLQKIGLAMHQYYLWIGLIFAGIWLYMVIPLTRNETNSPDEKPKEPS